MSKTHRSKPAPLAAESPYRVAFNGSFKLAAAATALPADAPEKRIRKQRLAKHAKTLAELQHVLYANDHRALLLIFQGMDAAGKDSTVRAVLSGVDPAGCTVHSFKRPSLEELDHDFLWRTTVRLPPRGTIGVFNRSYYEEVLAVRVHPELLQAQKLPDDTPLDQLWSERFESIRSHEQHLARSGTVILKFWLNVSREQQRARFLDRLKEPEKNWKFETADIAERARWHDYMAAYQDALNQTSRPWAPWYAIPADSKSYMRMTVAAIVVATLRNMKLRYPRVSEAQLEQFKSLRKRLEGEHVD
ncbi:MAG: polyphosphate kinase 2 family protein [Nevskia sp.]|nr:polyphosphate kinase 2 family protein [Nevskia sp.]